MYYLWDFLFSHFGCKIKTFIGSVADVATNTHGLLASCDQACGSSFSWSLWAELVSDINFIIISWPDFVTGKYCYIQAHGRVTCRLVGQCLLWWRLTQIYSHLLTISLLAEIISLPIWLHATFIFLVNIPSPSWCLSQIVHYVLLSESSRASVPHLDVAWNLKITEPSVKSTHCYLIHLQAQELASSLGFESKF